MYAQIVDKLVRLNFGKNGDNTALEYKNQPWPADS
jgi:hypothetical protein